MALLFVQVLEDFTLAQRLMRERSADEEKAIDGAPCTWGAACKPKETSKRTDFLIFLIIISR
jgi:hypothetical protein